MATFQRPQQQQVDPLAQAMEIYKMFNQPQANNELDAILGLIENQQTQQFRQQQLGQQEQEAQALQDYRNRALGLQQEEIDLRRQNVAQESVLTPEQIQALVTAYTDPNSPPAQKIRARFLLDPQLVAQIDAENERLKGELGLGGVGAEGGQPVQDAAPGGIMGAIGWGQPMAGGGPVGVGQQLGELLKGLFTQPTNALRPSPDVFSAGPNTQR